MDWTRKVNPVTSPSVFYDRQSATKNKSHRPYRIFLRKKYD